MNMATQRAFGFGFFAALTWGGGAINYIADITTRFSRAFPLTSPRQRLSFYKPICFVKILQSGFLPWFAPCFNRRCFGFHYFSRRNSPRRRKIRPRQRTDNVEDLAAGGRSFLGFFAINN